MMLKDFETKLFYSQTWPLNLYLSVWFPAHRHFSPYKEIGYHVKFSGIKKCVP